MARLYLLGDLRVELDGAVTNLASASRKARLLLAILAIERRVHGRSELAGRLWPDVREDSARVSLRTALSQLRTALGAASGAVLRSERDGGVSLGAEIQTDVDDVARLLAAGEVEAALAHCAAELLAGLDDDWVLERRDELRERLAQGAAPPAASFGSPSACRAARPIHRLPCRAAETWKDSRSRSATVATPSWRSCGTGACWRASDVPADTGFVLRAGTHDRREQDHVAAAGRDRRARTRPRGLAAP
jgi:hypothetical protein